MGEEALVRQVRKIYDENVRLAERNNELINAINKLLELRNRLRIDLDKLYKSDEVNKRFKKYYNEEGKILDALRK